MDTFQDGPNKPVLLIGNGFNLALKAISSFNIKLDYKSIIKEVQERVHNNGAQELFDFLSQKDIDKSEIIYDIEQLLHILQTMPICFKYGNHIYCNSIQSQECINRHRTLLKKLTLEVMTSSEFHPEYESIINYSNQIFLNKCAENINRFSKIFTINYDLILYWLLVQKNLLEKRGSKGHIISSGKFKDGFTSNPQFSLHKDGKQIKNLYGCSSNNINANIFFLHGAIHLLEKDSRAFKVIRGASHLKLTELRDSIKEQFKNHTTTIDNLIVFDGTSYEKTQSIYHNVYLEKAYDKLLSVDRDIIVYGCKIVENEKFFFGNDIHLWRKLMSSKARSIYVGIDEENPKLLDYCTNELYKNCKTLGVPRMTELQIHCYPQLQVNIWNSDNFIEEVKNSCSNGYSIH
jgi:hypothetical protein